MNSSPGSIIFYCYSLEHLKYLEIVNYHNDIFSLQMFLLLAFTLDEWKHDLEHTKTKFSAQKFICPKVTRGRE